jgi:antitoxin component YwqK of YwqJK toxin-antitoxin module
MSKANISKIVIYLFLVLNFKISYSQKVITKLHYGSNVIKEQYQVNAQGLRNGFYKSYNPDGILIYSYNFNSGKENGLCIDYAGSRNYKDIYCYGKPLRETVMENGKIKSEKYYDCANNTNYIVFLKKLIAPDVYERIEYYKNGKIKEKFNENASYNKVKGGYEKYYENGKLSEKGLIDGGKFGNWVGFYENGDTLYFSRFNADIETYYKKYYSNNKLEFVVTLDENFETISKIIYYPDGKIKSDINSKTFPFKYDCGGSNPPKNWKELAEGHILCGGDSYSPYDNAYIAHEKTFTSNGQIESEIINDLRIIKGKKIVAKKSEFEKEDKLWSDVQKEKSFQSIEKYNQESTLNIYADSVTKISNAIYAEWNKQFKEEMNKLKTEYNKIFTVLENKLNKPSDTDEIIIRQEVATVLKKLYNLDLKKINREIMFKELKSSPEELYDFLKSK